MKVLVIDDDRDFVEVLEKIFRLKGFEVESAFNYETAKQKIEHNFDLYLVDINFPGGNGLDLIEEIKRKNPSAFVVMITASSDVNDLVKAYEKGCDEYIKKPFPLRELEVRINHLMKKRKLFNVGDIKFDFENEKLFVDGEEIHLRHQEARLLKLLLENINRVVPKNEIIKYVWRDEKKENYPIRQLVNELRKKLGKDYIKTKTGVGYMFTMEN